MNVFFGINCIVLNDAE